jgi:hypothetical protein
MLVGPSAAAPPSPSDAAARRFFDAVRAHDYRAAYAMLSTAVMRSLPYGEFARRSADIKRFAIIELTAFDRGAHLVRYRVRGKVRMLYQGALFDAVYSGTADIALEGAGWRIAQVDLKPIEQKRVPGYHI